MRGTFFIFRPRIEKGSRVVYFLLPFFLFMSFSFYEPWVNTAHVNDILTQRAMNNAFEFTFMPELDPSQHPFSPSYFFARFPLLHPSSPHYSSSSELNLISPICAPPSFSPLLPALSSSYTSIRQQRGNRAGSDSSIQNWTSTVSLGLSSRSYSGGCSLIYFYNYEIRNWDTGRVFLQKLLSTKK